MQIKFGTDGWRARIAEDFTYANLEIVTQALADYLKGQNPTGRNSVLVGYDRRFASDLFAQRVAEVLAGNEIHVDLYTHDVPTPLVSFEVKRRHLDGGVVITASHNPPDFNGFKFKAPYGGAATPAITNEIEKLIGQTPPKRLAIDEALDRNPPLRWQTPGRNDPGVAGSPLWRGAAGTDALEPRSNCTDNSRTRRADGAHHRR
jgi:phosphomannomutase